MAIILIQLLIIILIVFSSFWVLFTKNLVHACFGAFFSFIGIASIYILYGADFVGVSQIMIYVGGILILVLFGVLITKAKNFQINIENDSSFFPILICIGISFLLLISNLSLFQILNSSKLNGSQIQNIGIELITSKILPFEIIGIILLIALIGASFIASTKK